MKILCTGATERFEEMKLKLSSVHELSFIDYNNIDFSAYEKANLIIDLNFDDEPGMRNFIYSQIKETPVFISTAKTSLVELKSKFPEIKSKLYGLNCLPTFINRPLWEMTVMHTDHKAELQKLCGEFGIEIKIVEDRVGMVTPRIIYMIINEAYYTVQEGTASKEDIDIAMKLGTNYPFGPFEWCAKTGIKNVYEVLEALYQDTHDERYKICPLLKREYLMGH